MERIQSYFCVAMSVATLFAAGCDRANQTDFRTLWGGTGVHRASKVGENFYQANDVRYPDVGIVMHFVDCGKLTPSAERSAIKKAIQLCQNDFSTAFHAARIRRFSSSDGLTEAFDPKVVVIMLVGIPKKGSQCVDTERIAYLVPAASLFSDAKMSQILESAVRSDSAWSYDTDTEVPRDQLVLDIVHEYDETLDHARTSDEEK